MKSYTGACIALTLLPVLAGTAAAQDVPHDRPGQDQASGNSPDIVVTANKREQNLNDVGTAVAVLQGDALKERQISSLADIAAAVPSLNYTNSAENTPVYTLRGVSFYDTSIASYGAVSLNMDEVPFTFPILAAHTAFDLDRVEVLKGPQGTLFGQNATGGAVNFVTAKPTSGFHAGADLSYGRFNEVTGEAFVSGPLTDTLRARVAGRFERADGWQFSNSRPGDRNGRIRSYMGRLLLDYQPTEGARLQINVNGWRDRSETQAGQYVGFQPGGLPLTPQLALYANAFSPPNARAADWTSDVPFANTRQWQATVRSDVDLSDAITLTTLTSYTDYRQRQGTDQDGLPIGIADHPRNDGRVKSFYGEARLSNGATASFRWTLGANGERTTAFQSVDTFYPQGSSFARLGIVSNTYSTDQTFRNYAVFGNVEYDVLDQVTLKGGLRYTNTRDVGTSCINDLSGSPTNSGPFFFGVLLGGRFGAYPTGACFAINNQATAIGGVAPGAPGPYSSTLQEDNVSWRGGIDWKPKDDVLFYANVSKGYKAGSFPTATGSVFTSYLPVTQESVLAYEAGLKAGLLDRTLQLELSGFYYDYTDKQIRAKTNAAPFGILDALQNVPKSSIRGFEASATIRPQRGFNIALAFSYIDARIDRFSGINGAGRPGVFDGTRMPFTPRYQVSVNPDYEFSIGGSATAFLGASVNFRSDTVAVIGGDLDVSTVTSPYRPVAGIDDFTLVDLRAGVRLADERYRISLFAKNVFNQYYWTNVFNTTDTVVRLAGRPATYGISLGARY